MGTPMETQGLIFYFETTSWNPTKPLIGGISLRPAISSLSPTLDLQGKSLSPMYISYSFHSNNLFNCNMLFY